MLLVDQYKQQTLAQIVLQATLHTIFEICHPILLFGTILLLNLCDLPPYTLIWHYTFIRHTRVYDNKVSAKYQFCAIHTEDNTDGKSHGRRIIFHGHINFTGTPVSSVKHPLYAHTLTLQLRAPDGN